MISSIRDFNGEAMFIYGQNEPYPRRSAALLKSFLPNLQIKELYDMGHGQYLFSYPEKYTNIMLDFLEGDSTAEKKPNAEEISNEGCGPA